MNPDAFIAVEMAAAWRHTPPWIGTHQGTYFFDNHHGDGRLALWCAAPEGTQAMLVDTNPEHYFLPPYVAHLGWIGVRLDRDAPWNEIAMVLESAHQTRYQPPRPPREPARRPAKRH